MICFNLFSIGLSQSHDSQYEFGRLIELTRMIFLIDFFFFNFILQH